MAKSLREWLSEGESIYAAALNEFQSLEAQIEQLEARLVEKRDEVNEIAQMINRPPVDGPKRISAQLIEQPQVGPIGTVARALTGRGIMQR